jgi:hypothetical protein
MSDVHAGPFHPHHVGVCGWRHHHCGVWLSCDAAVLPGEDLCPDHYIDFARVLADSEYAARIARRQRPA